MIGKEVVEKNYLPLGDKNENLLDQFAKREYLFSINDAIKQRTERFYDPANIEGGYFRLHFDHDGQCGPWLHYFCREYQEVMELDTPQSILLFSQTINKSQRAFEIYEGTLDRDDQ